MKYFSVLLSTLLAGLFASTGVIADNVSIPHTFTSGTPAVAGEVNANFEAIADVININDTLFNDHAADEAAHHTRYSDDEARNAMGQKSTTNAFNHDRYTDAEAMAAVQSANVFQPAYVRTVVVSPVGNLYENGAHLVNSLNSITDAGSENRYLLKIEPGVYHVASDYLVMRPYVDVEGSGVGVTRVTTDQGLSTQGTVSLADYAALRNLTVENYSGGRAIGISANDVTQGKVTNVRVDVNDVGIPQGVNVSNSSVIFDNVDITGSTSNANSECNALFMINSSGEIRNSRTSCSGGLRTTGLYFYNAHVQVRNVEASADAGQANIGLLTLSSDLGGYSVHVYNSKLNGAEYSVRATGDFDVYIGASQLSGGNSYVDIGTLTCIGVFDESFTNTGGYTACP